jgi:hypothetical protein
MIPPLEKPIELFTDGSPPPPLSIATFFKSDNAKLLFLPVFDMNGEPTVIGGGDYAKAT